MADQEAFIARYVEHDDDAALRAYRKEAKLNPKRSCTPCGPMEQAADTLVEEATYGDAIPLYSKIPAARALHDNGACESPRGRDPLHDRGTGQVGSRSGAHPANMADEYPHHRADGRQAAVAFPPFSP